MHNVTKSSLTEILTKYLKENKICADGFEVSRENIAGLLDKVGATFMIDGEDKEELAFMDATLKGPNTVEEYFEDFVPPEDYVKDAGVENVTRRDPTFRPVKYSYTQGKKKFKTTKPFNDLERAFQTEEGAAAALAKILSRLNSSWILWRNGVKRETVGQYAKRASSLMSNAKTFAVSTAYKVGESVKDANGNVAIVFNEIEASNKATYDALVKDGHLAPVNLATTIDTPSDNDTGKAFIKAVKHWCRTMAHDNHENLNGALTLATPSGSARLIINMYLMPDIEVETIAGAFHEEKLAMPVTIEEVQNFGSNSDVLAILVDERGLKLYNDYNALRTQGLADDDAMNFVKHTEDTAFYSANTFIHVFNKKA